MDNSLLKHLQSYYSKQGKSGYQPKEKSHSPVTSLPTTNKALDFEDELSFKKELIDSLPRQETPQIGGKQVIEDELEERLEAVAILEAHKSKLSNQ